MLSKQLISKTLGASGCYFLSLVYHAEKIAKKPFDVIELYDKVVKMGWLEKDCFVKNPSAIMSYLVGASCSVRHEPLTYEPKKNEYEITRYEKNATGTTYVHFVCTKDGSVIYDPYGKSSTVRDGKPVSKRIIKIGE